MKAGSFRQQRERERLRKSYGNLEQLGSSTALASSNGSDSAKSVIRSPTSDVLNSWRRAHAVCFDVDCTCTVNDSLDLLAEFMGVGSSVASITSSAMDGTMALEDALEERLRIINCSPQDIQDFCLAHPPSSRLAPGIKELISALHSRGVAVYLISGGFREMTLPIARELGVPATNVFANRMNWQMDDETGLQPKLVGFDLKEPTAHQRGKVDAIAKLRQTFPYETIIMIGDGITDLEAASGDGAGADIFVGYGGVVERQAVAEGADWHVRSFDELRNALAKHSVAFIGSGAWACAAAMLVATNLASQELDDQFNPNLRMWVRGEELADGRNLTDVVNETNENVKYLPGVKLGHNLTAIADLEEAVRDADILIFCVPHQFAHAVCKQLRGVTKPGAIAISLTKGMRVRADGPQLISEMVRKSLGCDCSVLMGANIAKDIGSRQLSEATIGYSVLQNGETFKRMFQTDYFYVDLVPDVAGAEMCGTLKNIVACGAGVVDGLGMGPNTKAAIIRQGLLEMRKLSERMYPAVREATFFESCGVADLIATCYGGRNRKVAEAYTRSILSGEPKTFEELEVELLNGQKLQGVLTSNEVQEVLRVRGWEADYPFFTTVNRVLNGQLPPSAVVEYRKSEHCAPTPNDNDDKTWMDVSSVPAGAVAK